jgi:hypothetical protein
MVLELHPPDGDRLVAEGRRAWPEVIDDARVPEAARHLGLDAREGGSARPRDDRGPDRCEGMFGCRGASAAGLHLGPDRSGAHAGLIAGGRPRDHRTGLRDRQKLGRDDDRLGDRREGLGVAIRLIAEALGGVRGPPGSSRRLGVAGHLRAVRVREPRARPC